MKEGIENRSNDQKAMSSGYVDLGDIKLAPLSDINSVAKSLSESNIHGTSSLSTGPISTANPALSPSIIFPFPNDTHKLHESATVEYQNQENTVNQLSVDDISRLQQIDRNQLLNHFVGALCSKENIVDANTALQYLCTYPSKKELEKYQVEIKNEQVYYKHNKQRLSPGKYRFVAIEQTLYAVKGQLGIILYHSFLSEGQRVAASGILYIGWQGYPTRISNESGHYRIDCDNFIDFLAYMLQRLNNPFLVFEDHTMPDTVREYNALQLVCAKKKLNLNIILPKAPVVLPNVFREYPKSADAKARTAAKTSPEVRLAVASLIRQQQLERDQKQKREKAVSKIRLSVSAPTLFSVDKAPVEVHSTSVDLTAPSSPYRSVVCT